MMLARSSRRPLQRLAVRASSSATTTKGTSNTTSSIGIERSKAEIEALVQKRVQERDAWAVDGVTAGQPSLSAALNFMWKLQNFAVPSQTELDQELPVLHMDWTRLQNPENDKIQITWLGHASLLVQMNGCNLLCDPVFSQRCSPSQWFGPQRYRPLPCSIQELLDKVDIDLVLISHNHYDHLDCGSVQDFCKLSSSTPFVVPLGLKDWFQRHVSQTMTLYEQDWNESIDFVGPAGNKLTITSVPMRHWSNRTGDRDKTLWCGYSVASQQKKFLFTGDTAWFDDLEQVGAKYGPFDVAAIPIGAYEPRDFMKYNHINVEEAVRMKDAVQAASAVPIHWGTFPLTIEPVLEPREKLIELMKHRPDADSFCPWSIGETKQF